MRLIDAEPIEIRYNTEALSRREMYEMVKNAPTIDAVPVVRCKDCKHSEYDELFHMRWCNGEKVKDDDYCSCGERKDDE